MNTYQVHVVARRCAGVRDHACAGFLRLWNAATAVRLNRRVSPRSWTSHRLLLHGRHRDRLVPSRLISYETERDRLITVEFVAQLYRQPLHRVVAASSSSSAIYDRFLSTTRFAASRIHSLSGNSSLSRSFLIATAFFGETVLPSSRSRIPRFKYYRNLEASRFRMYIF